MPYSFDSHGWLSSSTIPGRETNIAPPAHGDKIVGQPYPNFTGVEWVMVPYSEPPVPQPVQPVNPPRITKLQFMDRFSDAELAGIYATAKSVPMVEVWLAKLNAVTPEPDGTSIDLTDPRTIAGVQGLEAGGLLGPGRAAEILTP